MAHLQAIKSSFKHLFSIIFLIPKTQFAKILIEFYHSIFVYFCFKAGILIYLKIIKLLSKIKKKINLILNNNSINSFNFLLLNSNNVLEDLEKISQGGIVLIGGVLAIASVLIALKLWKKQKKTEDITCVTFGCKCKPCVENVEKAHGLSYNKVFQIFDESGIFLLFVDYKKRQYFFLKNAESSILLHSDVQEVTTSSLEFSGNAFLTHFNDFTNIGKLIPVFKKKARRNDLRALRLHGPTTQKECKLLRDDFCKKCKTSLSLQFSSKSGLFNRIFNYICNCFKF